MAPHSKITWLQISTKNGVGYKNSSTLSVFGVGKREPIYSNEADIQ